MKKRDLLIKYNSLLEENGLQKMQTMNETVGVNSCKAQLKSAIDCLSASDNEMLERLEQIKEIYPAIYKAILEAGNFLTHPFNRFYVYSITSFQEQ